MMSNFMNLYDLGMKVGFTSLHSARLESLSLRLKGKEISATNIVIS